MMPGAIFVNGARGAIVDEVALIDALRDSTILAVGLDVFDNEPLDPGSPLMAMPNVVLPPHISSATSDTRQTMAKRAVDNIIAALDGRPQCVANPAAIANIRR